MRANRPLYSKNSHRTTVTSLSAVRNDLDLVQVASGEQRAYIAATAVHHLTSGASATMDILSIVKLWSGRVSGDAAVSFQYDRSWLAPDLPLIWLKAYNLLRRRDEENLWFRLHFSLPAMAYASSQLADLVPMFVAFASDPQFQMEDPPHYVSYDLSDGSSPSVATLRSYVSDCAYSFERSPESKAPANPGESKKALRKRRLKMYENRRNSESDTGATVSWLLNAWPCETPPLCFLNPTLYDVPKFTSNVQRHFSSCYQNLKLKEHLIRVQAILWNVGSQATPIPALQYTFRQSKRIRIPSPTSWSLTVDQLLARAAPSLQPHDTLPTYTANDGNTSLSGSAPLHRLITRVEADAVNQFQLHYVSALRASAECLGSEISLVPHGATKLPTIETLVAHYVRCRASYIKGLDLVKQYLGPRSPDEQALEQSGQWPCITPHTLFRSLASNSSVVLFDDWKKCLIRLTQLALELQRARRMVRLHFDDLHEELRRELENEGCDGWNADTHPDWLLIQVCFSCDGCVY